MQETRCDNEERIGFIKYPKLSLPKMEIRLKKVFPDSTKEDFQLDTESAILIVDTFLREQASEAVISINCVNTSALNYHICGVGTTDGVDTRSICHNAMKSALLSNANMVAFVHNHPDGKPEASRGDLETIYTLAQLCMWLDIEIYDFIIVSSSSDEIYSCKQHYPEAFEVDYADWDELFPEDWQNMED